MSNNNTTTNKKVAVIGAGCAGLSAAWHLNRKNVEVYLFESSGRVGGHANTLCVDGVNIDTGFMVYNRVNYPQLNNLFSELKVEGENTNMGFSVSMDEGLFEWCGDSLRGLFASLRNIINPSFYVMMSDILRFNREAIKFLKLPENDKNRELTVAEFLKKKGLSEAFAKYYLIPMTSAIWSATTEGIMSFPMMSLITFLNNHLLLQVSGHMVWRTPSGRSQVYVNAILKELDPSKVFTDTTIVSCIRKTDGLYLTDNNGIIRIFDEIVFACHPDQALQILGNVATKEESETLAKFHYSSNDVYVHSDESLMPRSKHAWASWNYLGYSNTYNKKYWGKPVFVTYWINRLQNIIHSKQIFVSLNPHNKPDEKKTYSKLIYAHPQYTIEAVKAQEQMSSIQGRNKTWYCGAWLGYGFHEDGVRTGLQVAVDITDECLPWDLPKKRLQGTNTIITTTTATATVSSTSTSNSTIFHYLRKPFTFLTSAIVSSFISLCQSQVIAFLKSGFKKGKLAIILPSNEILTFGELSSDHDIVVRVINPWFWVRVALEYDLGLGKSYIAGEWEISSTHHFSQNHEALTKMLIDFIGNMPVAAKKQKSKKESTALQVSSLATAWIGNAVNWLWYYFTMDNTIANSRSNIHAHYDLSNELFRTFLDKDHMMYSCGLFDIRLGSTTSPLTAVTTTTTTTTNNTAAITTTGSSSSYTHMNGHSNKEIQPIPIPIPLYTSPYTPKVNFLDSLEHAQQRKIDALLGRLGTLTANHTLLDIGFGWGGISIRAAELYGCKVTGITLSQQQKEMAERRVRRKGLAHLITFQLIDYRLFAKKGLKFDRIVSCEMIEAVGHNHLGEFFDVIETLLVPDGIFVMQAITTPESRYTINVKSADFCNTVIFPGGCCPSLTALLDAMTANSTLYLDSMINSNIHYAHTLREWRQRFNDSSDRVHELGFDDAFIRCWNFYLCYCEAGFETQIMNLLILTFSRPGNPNLLNSRTLLACGKTLLE